MTQTEIDAIARVLDEWGAERTENAKEILRLKKAFASGLTAQSIYADKSFISLNGLKLNIKAADHYIFVDEGVKGLQNKKDNTGRFKFKTLFVGKKFKQAISDWITSKGVPVREDKKESKESVMKRKESMSWAIAKSIKKSGLRRTDFWSDTFNEESYRDLADRIAKELGGTFSITIK